MVVIVTNYQELTCCRNVIYVVVSMSHVSSVSMDNIFKLKREVQYAKQSRRFVIVYLFVIFVGYLVKHRPRRIIR
jgi:hypothetical protein